MPSIVRRASSPPYSMPMPKSQAKALFDAALHCMDSCFEFAVLNRIVNSVSYEESIRLETKLFDAVLQIAGMRWTGDLPASRKAWIGSQLSLAGTHLADTPAELLLRIGAFERHIRWEM